MADTRTPSRQQRRAAERAAASPATYASTPSPYGPRVSRRAHRREPRPPQLPPTSTRLVGALSRPRPVPEKAEHRDSHYGASILVGLGLLDQWGRSRRHVYGGTVAWPTVRDRRRRNHLARIARRATQKAAA